MRIGARFATRNSLFLPKPLEREQLLQELRRLTSQTGTRRLLIVDDNEVSRYIVRELLDRPWLEVSEAKSGSEALRLIDGVRPGCRDPRSADAGHERNGSTSAGALPIPPREHVPVLIYTSKTLTDGRAHPTAIHGGQDRTERGDLDSALCATFSRLVNHRGRLARHRHFATEWLITVPIAS